MVTSLVGSSRSRIALALCAPAVAATAMSVESVIKVFLIFVSSIRESGCLITHSGYEFRACTPVGLHLNFGGNVTELSTRNAYPYLRETLTGFSALIAGRATNRESPTVNQLLADCSPSGAV